MTIRRLLFARPVPLPADAAATHLSVDDDRYASVATELKNAGVQLTITERAGKVSVVYIPLANVTCIHGEPDATPAPKGK